MQDSRQRAPNRRPEDPGDGHKVFWIYVLVLGSGTMLFFLGGLMLRNPNLPSYLYSQVNSWWKNENDSSSHLRPSASPKSAGDYLALTHYDVRALPPDQRAIALALADAIGNAAALQDRLAALEQLVRNDLASLKSANAISVYAKINPEATKLLNAANQQKLFFENLESTLTGQLANNGVRQEIARQVASLFYESTRGQKAVDQAAKSDQLATEILAIANLLEETPSKWRVSSDGTIHSPDKKLDEEFQAHAAAVRAAISDSSQ
jgi:hypothetical protein